MNSSKNFFQKNIGTLLLFSCFLILFIYSVIFYIERLYGDSAFYLFQLIDSRNFITQHGRPVSVFIQIIPLLLVKLSAPLNMIILFFSINEWLYFFTCTILLRLISKSWIPGFILVFSILLGIRWNYFNPVSELVLAAPFLLFLIVIYKTSISFSKKIIIQCGTIILLVFSHPIYSILIPVILIFFIVESRIVNKEITWLFIISIIIICIHYLIIDKYEQDPLKELGDASKTGLNLIIRFNYGRLISGIVPAYLGAFILFGVSIFTLVKSSKKSISIFLLIFTLSYFFLVMFKYGRFFPDTYEPFERYLFPIPFVICFVYFNFCFKNSVKEIILLSCIACYHFAGIFNYGSFVREHYSTFQNAITNCHQFEGYKFAYRKENYYAQSSGQDWIMSTESILLSALGGSDKAKQVFIEDFYGSLKDNLLKESQFIYFPYPMWRKEINEINTDYFNMHDSPLKYVNSDSIQSDYSDAFFKNIILKVGGKTQYKKGSEIIIPISVINNNPVPLASGLRREKIYISYHWIQGGDVIEWDGLRTPIMCDVEKSIAQFMLLKTPQQKGFYTLRADIVFEGKKWANVSWMDHRGYKIY